MDSLLLHDLSESQRYKHTFRPSGVYIYGTGVFAQDVRRTLQLHDIEILGFIDHRKNGIATLNDLPVYLPDDPNIHSENRANSDVVLGIHNREANVLQIIATLKRLGYHRVISPIDLYDDFQNELGSRYWLTSRTYYASYLNEIRQVYDLLSDETSLETFASMIRFRITGDYSLLPQPDIQHQYFPPDLPAWINPIRFVDCGAYVGDTLRSFIDAGFRFQSIAAFEPDLDSFHTLSEYVVKNRRNFPSVALFPCGVYSSTTKLNFDAGRGEASVTSITGSSTIQCVSLDECIPTFQSTLIKMDIEGAEVSALYGAEHSIREYKPALAISVYHSPEHIWQVPLLINKIALENHLKYKYHLRAHAHNCFDTIFYAIPSRQP